MTDYFTRPELPGKTFFDCDRLLATISTDSCRSMWRQANHENSERYARCKHCQIGATHAGEPNANLSALHGSLICARCQRSSSRLIGKHLCVSCQNREYEWKKGCNAKGSKPIKMRPLAPRCIRFLDGREPCTLRREYTQHPDELVIAAVRKSHHKVSFGFHATIVGERQARLF